MPTAMDVLAAAYEVSTVVTDVVLNAEYIRRKWIEEYILSIAFLVFSGCVMGLVGIALEPKQRNRYVRSSNSLNAAIAFLLGLLQLRVLAETIYVFRASRRASSAASNQPAQLQAPNSSTTTAASSSNQNSDELSLKRLTDGLKFAAFVQAIVRDIPIFIIQANATIHYRKWAFLDLWAVSSTGLTLVLAVAGYVCKKDTGALRYASYAFLTGQFVLRAGALLLVAMTTKLLIAQYAIVITISAVLWCSILRVAHTSPRWSVQLTRALLFFPFFTLFVVDASQLTARDGTARKTLMGPKLYAIHVWRVLESVAGVLFAVHHKRYTDFGTTGDDVIACAGLICGAVFAVSIALFAIVAACTAKPKSERFRDEVLADSPVIMQAQHTRGPNVAYSTMAAQA